MHAMRLIEEQTKILDRECVRFVPNYYNKAWLLIKSGPVCYVEVSYPISKGQTPSGLS